MFFFLEKDKKLSSKTSLSSSVTVKLLKHITRTLSVTFEGQQNETTKSEQIFVLWCHLQFGVRFSHLKDLCCSVKTYVYALERTFVAYGPGNASRPVTCHGTATIKARQMAPLKHRALLWLWEQRSC